MRVGLIKIRARRARRHLLISKSTSSMTIAYYGSDDGGLRRRCEMRTGMLDGYKVLDFTQALAGPTTTRYLGQMGAEIIKVEIAPYGDISRGIPYMRDGRS